MITHHASRITFLVLLLGLQHLAFLLQPCCFATEDPPNCDLSNGGAGNTSQGGINWAFGQAHVGDTVAVVPSFGMSLTACSADSVTGSVYIATGFLTNFLVNVHSYPTGGVMCPAGVQCEPGPYNVTITAPLVGAGVTSPNGSVGGAAKAVRAVENAVGLVNTIVGANVTDFHSASIAIVTPCIQVFKTCTTTNCVGTPVEFTGYVTNCGDITLTNVNVVDDRTASLFEPDGDPLPLPLTLTNGAVVQFKGSFTPVGSETATATNTLIVTAKDTTTIGGPYASVTNTVTAICTVTACTTCTCPCLIWNQPVRRQRYATR